MIQEINEFLMHHAEAVLYAGAAFFLLIHFLGLTRDGPMVVLFTMLVISGVAIFVILLQAPEPISLTLVAAFLVVYGVALFVVLSDLMMWGLAKYLTTTRGEKWTRRGRS